MRGFTRVASRIALLLLRLEFLVRGRVGIGKDLATNSGSLPASGGSKRSWVLCLTGVGGNEVL